MAKFERDRSIGSAPIPKHDTPVEPKILNRFIVETPVHFGSNYINPEFGTPVTILSSSNMTVVLTYV